MSFRCGNQGPSLWRECFRLGVAAIAYEPLDKTDLTKYPKGEPKKLWAQLWPAQQASLRRVAYEMKAGDVIYVKEGPQIAGKGVVRGSYKFDYKFRLLAYGEPWTHQVPVEWQPDFPPVRILLGAEQLTVKELSADEVRKIEAARGRVTKSNRQSEVTEGKIYRAEAVFRSRNHSLIQAKKSNSGYRCEVCGFIFEEKYGAIGREYIVAHHLNPVALGVAKTTLDDIALLCANCHSMVHTEKTPISIDKLRRLVKHRRTNV
jgi:5-methylcytosine-specific restriction endonuclease McrA